MTVNNKTVFFFSGILGEKYSPSPPSLKFPPQTITNWVCFLDVFHIFPPHKSNFPALTTFIEKTLQQSQVEMSLYYILLPLSS